LDTADGLLAPPKPIGRRRVERRLGLLVCHFQEQQKRELLDIVAIREAIVPKDVAVIPKLSDELG